MELWRKAGDERQAEADKGKKRQAKPSQSHVLFPMSIFQDQVEGLGFQVRGG